MVSPYDENEIGVHVSNDGLERLQHSRRLRSVRAERDPELPVRGRDTELGEEHGREPIIKVLPRVDQGFGRDLPQPG